MSKTRQFLMFIGRYSVLNPDWDSDALGSLGCRRLGLMLLILMGVGAVGQASSASFPSFSNGVEQGVVSTANIFEASGLAASRQNPGVLWTHNDNKVAAFLFAISTNGNLLATWQMSNVFSGDFEDIAIGPGPDPELHYIYFGDIGNNDLLWDHIRVVRVPEPAIYPYTTNDPPLRTLGGAVEIFLRYPDERFDAETLMSDPITGDLFIASKDVVNTSARIYRVPKALLDMGGTIEMEFVRDVPFRAASAGDISADGSEIILRRGSNAELWKRAPGTTVGQALGTASRSVPVIGQPVEPNGEAVAFHPTGLGYYTLSEGLNQPIYFFRRTSPNLQPQPVVLFPPASSWRFFDFDAEPEGGWMEPEFNAAGWRMGMGKFGYGQGDERSVVDFGFDQDFKIVSAFFRTQFQLGNPYAFTNLQVRLLYSDGIAMYLNGTEILRRRLAAGATPYDYATEANTELEMAWVTLPLAADQFQPGTNTWAVELHRYNSYGPTLSFDLQLIGELGQPEVRFAGAPVREEEEWRMQILGPLDATVEMEVSSNLVHWTSLGLLHLTNGTGQFRDSSGLGIMPRFYRALLR